MDRKPSALKGAAAGLAAGLIASFAMDRFQGLWTRLIEMPKSGEPATLKAARRIDHAIGGDGIAKADEAQAGTLVHYAFGAALGVAYAVASEFRPSVTKGFGSRFALASATAFDEVAVPAMGLSKPPTRFGAKVHLYSYVSHLVFGAVTEGVRRSLRRG